MTWNHHCAESIFSVKDSSPCPFRWRVLYWWRHSSSCIFGGEIVFGGSVFFIAPLNWHRILHGGSPLCAFHRRVLLMEVFFSPFFYVSTKGFSTEEAHLRMDLPSRRATRILASRRRATPPRRTRRTEPLSLIGCYPTLLLLPSRNLSLVTWEALLL